MNLIFSYRKLVDLIGSDDCQLEKAFVHYEEKCETASLDQLEVEIKKIKKNLREKREQVDMYKVLEQLLIGKDSDQSKSLKQYFLQVIDSDSDIKQLKSILKDKKILLDDLKRWKNKYRDFGVLLILKFLSKILSYNSKITKNVSLTVEEFMYLQKMYEKANFPLTPTNLTLQEHMIANLPNLRERLFSRLCQIFEGQSYPANDSFYFLKFLIDSLAVLQHHFHSTYLLQNSAFIEIFINSSDPKQVKLSEKIQNNPVYESKLRFSSYLFFRIRSSPFLLDTSKTIMYEGQILNFSLIAVCHFGKDKITFIKNSPLDLNNSSESADSSKLDENQIDFLMYVRNPGT